MTCDQFRYDRSVDWARTGNPEDRHLCRCGSPRSAHPAERTVNLSGHSILMEFHAERRRMFDAGESIETLLWDDPAVLTAWTYAVELVWKDRRDMKYRTFPEQIALLRADLVRLGAFTEIWVQAIDAAATPGHPERPTPPVDAPVAP